MRTFLVLICFLGLAALACSSTILEPPQPTVQPIAIDGEEATVTEIIDGDTVDIRLGDQIYRLRYIGIDTPERDELFYKEATAANRALVEGRRVTLVKDVSETDRYGRLLRYVYLPDGTFVNAELVSQGYATSVTFPPDVRHVDLFRALEREARLEERGLWRLSP